MREERREKREERREKKNYVIINNKTAGSKIIFAQVRT